MRIIIRRMRITQSLYSIIYYITPYLGSNLHSNYANLYCAFN